MSTTSGKNGDFQFFRAFPAGEYKLIVMHPEYNTIFRPFSVGADGEYDFDTIPMFRRVDSMPAVVVRPGEARPYFNRDTVQFNTAHIQMSLNANVEELLNRLTGLLVDADGNITYNGQRIQRVLVDGKELFGSDLTVVTRNLNADMIRKIQIVDGKSPKATFTGIDDGQRVKTLYLTLKDDSKAGYFIKGGTGADQDKYYRAGGILGSFHDKQQYMIVGLASNTGEKGYDGRDGAFGTGLNFQGNVADPLGASAGAGIPTVLGGAAHYAGDWGRLGDHGDGYTRCGHVFTRPYSSRVSTQTIPTGSYSQSELDSSVNKTSESAVNAHLFINTDTLTEFQFNLRQANSQARNLFTSNQGSSIDDTLLNSSKRSINSAISSGSLSGDLMWRHLGRRNHDRILSVLTTFTKQTSATNGFLYSLNNYFSPEGIALRTDTVNQRKLIDDNNFSFDASINYTEPISKSTVLAFGYGANFANSMKQQSTFNSNGGKFDEIVDSLTSHYRDNLLTWRQSVNLQASLKAIQFSVGTDVLQFRYQQTDIFAGTTSKYIYANLVPHITTTYSPNSYLNYSFNYIATMELPTFTQLQPVTNNSDPLHLTVGNPNLRPTYLNSFDLNVHWGRKIFYTAGWNLTINGNSISLKTVTDTLGRQISQFVDTKGAGSAGLYFYLNTKLKPLELDLGLTSNLAYDRTVNYVNDLLSRNDTYTTTTGFSLAKYVANVYNFRINTNFAYNTTSSSINPAQKTAYWSQTHTAQAGFFPWKNWEIGANLNYTWRQKTSVFDNNNAVLLWNAVLNRNFLDNTLTARFVVNDILGQNEGITRTINANQISQTTSNVIGRYWMVSVLYRLTKKGRK